MVGCHQRLDAPIPGLKELIAERDQALQLQAKYKRQLIEVLLSKEELKVFVQMASRRSNSEIAQLVGKAPNYVRTVKLRLLKKLAQSDGLLSSETETALEALALEYAQFLPDTRLKF